MVNQSSVTLLPLGISMFNLRQAHLWILTISWSLQDLRRIYSMDTFPALLEMWSACGLS
jgi:hypothetical protein